MSIRFLPNVEYKVENSPNPISHSQIPQTTCDKCSQKNLRTKQKRTFQRAIRTGKKDITQEPKFPGRSSPRSSDIVCRCSIRPRRPELGRINSSEKLRLRCNSSMRERGNQCDRSLRAISRLIRWRAPEEYGLIPRSEISLCPRSDLRLKIRRGPLY